MTTQLIESARIDVEKKTEYEICLDLGLGITLPEQKKYKIKMCITSHSLLSIEARDFGEANNGYNQWSQRIIEKFELPYEEINQIDYIYIYLVDPYYKSGTLAQATSKTISYCKIHVSKFLEAKDWEYHQFMIDPSMNET